MSESASSPVKEGYKASLDGVVERARGQAETHRRATQRWNALHFLIGLPAVILTAVAAATALASTAGRIPAGIICLMSVGLSAAKQFLDCEIQTKRHADLTAGWQRLAGEADTHLKVKLVDEAWILEDALVTLQWFQDREGQLLAGIVPQMALHNEVVSARDLSDHTEELLAATERRDRPLLISTDNRLVAALLPVTLPQLARILEDKPELREAAADADRALETIQRPAFAKPPKDLET